MPKQPHGSQFRKTAVRWPGCTLRACCKNLATRQTLTMKATYGRSAIANMAVLINTAEVSGRLAVAHHRYKANQ